MVGTLQVTGSDVTVASLNGLDVAAAAADLVLVDQDATITGGLRVSGNVNSESLSVRFGSRGLELIDASMTRSTARDSC